MHLARGLALYGDVEDQRGVAGALFILGDAAFLQGDCKQATAHYQESLTISQATENTQQIAQRILRRGQIAWAQGDTARATRYIQESLTCCWETHNKWGKTIA